MADNYPDQPLLTPAEAAEVLGVSERTLYRWREAGAGAGPPFIRLGEDGGLIRYPPLALGEFLLRRMEE